MAEGLEKLEEKKGNKNKKRKGKKGKGKGKEAGVVVIMQNNYT